MQSQYIIYTLVFLSILLIVEGIYLFGFASNGREAAVNRRMQLAKRGDATTVAPSLMRQQVIGGPISQWLLKQFPALERSFWAAGLSIAPGRAFVGCLIAFAAILVFLGLSKALPFPVQLVIAGVLAFGIPILVLNIAVQRQQKKFADQLPDAINLVTRGLQAGHPVPVAFGLVAREMQDPIGTQFGTALDEMNFGRDRALALRDIGERFPNAEFLFFTAAIEMQRESGGNLVNILDNLVKTMRERSNLKKKAFAMSAG